MSGNYNIDKYRRMNSFYAGCVGAAVMYLALPGLIEGPHIDPEARPYVNGVSSVIIGFVGGAMGWWLINGHKSIIRDIKFKSKSTK